MKNSAVEKEVPKGLEHKTIRLDFDLSVADDNLLYRHIVDNLPQGGVADWLKGLAVKEAKKVRVRQ